MSESRESAVPVFDRELSLLSAAWASGNPRMSVLRAVETIAVSRMEISVFSVSKRLLGPDLERIYCSRPDVFPVGAQKSKRQTSWADQVLRDRHVFVGEGPLEMAAAFDSQEMSQAGIRSIINVPIVVSGKCVGVLNFGRERERVSPGEVLLGRFLAVAVTPLFLDEAKP